MVVHLYVGSLMDCVPCSGIGSSFPCHLQCISGVDNQLLSVLNLPVYLCFALYRKLGDGLFLQCCKEVAAGYPDITFDNMIVDNTTMQVSIFRHALRN